MRDAAQRARDAGGPHPRADLPPGALVVVDRARDGVVRDPRARERARDLRHAARRAVGQPLAGAGVRVVERRARLEAEHDDRRLRRLRHRQHRARGRVGDGVAEHEVDLRGREAVARLAARSARVDEPGGDDVPAERADALLDAALVALDPLAEARELRPVGVQADPEHPDAGARRMVVGDASSTTQKSKSSTLSFVNVVSGPSTISPSTPIVYSPSRPASNFSPSLPVIRPERARRRPGPRGSRRPWAPRAGTRRRCRP